MSQLIIGCLLHLLRRLKEILMCLLYLLLFLADSPFVIQGQSLTLRIPLFQEIVTGNVYQGIRLLHIEFVAYLRGKQSPRGIL